MIDCEQTFWELATADDGGVFHAAVGTRVWNEHKAGFANTQAAVVFTATPLGTDAAGSLHRMVVNCICYGGTANVADARAVARALWDKLHAKGGRTAAGEIHRCFHTGGGALPPDPVTKFPRHSIQFEVILQEG